MYYDGIGNDQDIRNVQKVNRQLGAEQGPVVGALAHTLVHPLTHARILYI